MSDASAIRITEATDTIASLLADRTSTLDGCPVGLLVEAGARLQRLSAVRDALAQGRSAVLLPSSAAFMIALSAAAPGGSLLLNPLAAAPEVAYQLDDAAASIVFTTTALASTVPADRVLVLFDAAPDRVEIVPATQRRERGHGVEAEAIVIYTSAMAGTPLGARLTHTNIVSNAVASVDALDLRPTDHLLSLIPFAHAYGLTVSALAPLSAGARVSAVPLFDPALIVRLINEQGVTHIVATPAVFEALLSALGRRKWTVARGALRVCVCGGAPLPFDLHERWTEATGVELRQGYGLTEAGPVSLFNRADQPNRRGTLGVPYPGVDVSIRDAVRGTPVAPGQSGEICVRGPNLFAGYIGHGAGLAVRDGWLYTGDIGVQHHDGAFTFEGVSKRMFTRFGFNIYPAELERVVARMPGVASVSASAIPGVASEHDIKLTVRGDVTDRRVRDWCATQLSAYKRPSQIEIR